MDVLEEESDPGKNSGSPIVADGFPHARSMHLNGQVRYCNCNSQTEHQGEMAEHQNRHEVVVFPVSVCRFNPQSSSLVSPHRDDPIASAIELVLMYLQGTYLVHLYGGMKTEKLRNNKSVPVTLPHSTSCNLPNLVMVTWG
eukprot:5973403-Amphidinium_carterae.1